MLGAVASIAAQSRTLALDGSVEATRAGDADRAFAEVTREMLALAEDAHASAATIRASIEGARTALDRHAAAVTAIGDAAGGRLEALRDSTRAVAELAARVGGLALSSATCGAAGAAAEENFDERFRWIAGRFVELVTAETDHAVIVCDASATIVRATDRKRIGQKHAGAARVLAGELDEAAVTSEEAARSGTMKEGCSCPIVVGGRRIGTFGITGPLAVTRPLARVAASVLAARVREHRSRVLLEREAAKAYAAVDALAARSAAAVGEVERAAAVAREAAQALAQRLDETEAVLGEISQISQQSRIIAVNASVEASAQERGQAFGNVAGGMRALAEEAHRAGGEISEAIVRIRAAVAEMAEAGAARDRAVCAQAEASAAVVAAARGVRGTLSELVGSFET